MNIPIEVSSNPAIVEFEDGKTYAVAGSHVIEVPRGTARSDLREWMIWKIKLPEYEIVEVVGSKGKTYNVKKDIKTGDISCSCPGFKWHGKCKHLTIVF
jgi:hypothetical protein